MFFQVLFSIITLGWLLEFIVHRPDRGNEGERQSLRIIWAMLLIAILLSVFSANFTWMLFSESTLMTILKWLGVCMYACGVGLRWWGIHELGANFSRRVKQTHDQQLVSTGPYRLLAHPLYAGILLALNGIALSLSAWLGLFAVWMLVLPAILYRIHLEERVMKMQFVGQYENWLADRYRLIPFLY
jgi:protein-S-isoprenylcysteine O-methyltransferase Ste14